jgi:TonB family protein
MIQPSRPESPFSLAVWPSLLAALIAACSKPDTGTMKLPEKVDPKGFEPPVMLNAGSPVAYPEALYAQGIEGRVVLRLFVDEKGKLESDSTRLAESSGYPALDSAALRAVADFRFAPALRNGAPVAALFLQPVHFRHPQAGGTSP